MQNTSQTLEPVYSAYGYDPDLADSVVAFANDLSSRVENLRAYIGCDDIQNLRRATQQLRLSAAGHGFDQLVPCMQRLESLIRCAASGDELELAFQEVVETCDRVRPGGPG